MDLEFIVVKDDFFKGFVFLFIKFFLRVLK